MQLSAGYFDGSMCKKDLMFEHADAYKAVLKPVGFVRFAHIPRIKCGLATLPLLRYLRRIIEHLSVRIFEVNINNREKVRDEVAGLLQEAFHPHAQKGLP